MTEFRQKFSFADLSDFFAATPAVYVDWLRERHHWCLARDASIAALAFPFPNYRPGQRELAVAAYRVLADGGRLFLAAPTGIGKTISVLFPAVKALGEGKLERIFYLTARTVGRAIAEKALLDLRRAGLKLRAVTLTAKEKVCVRDGNPCDPLTCPLALGYYDRVKPAIRAALEHEEITRSVLETVGQKHQVCPFELSLDVSVWADAIICDYNYVFDPRVYLRRHFAEDGGAYGFLVDEAHNLVDRAREMFSADLDGKEILDVKRTIKSSAPRCSKALTQLLTVMGRLVDSSKLSDESFEASDPASELNLFPARTAQVGNEENIVSTSPEFPDSLIEPLETALDEAETGWSKTNRPNFAKLCSGCISDLHLFRRTGEVYDERFVTIVENDPAIKVRLFCLGSFPVTSKGAGSWQGGNFLLRHADTDGLLSNLVGRCSRRSRAATAVTFSLRKSGGADSGSHPNPFQGPGGIAWRRGGSDRSFGAGATWQLPRLFSIISISQCHASSFPNPQPVSFRAGPASGHDRTGTRRVPDSLFD